MDIELIQRETKANKQALAALEISLGIKAKMAQITELEAQSQDPTFWEDSKNSQKILKEIKSLKTVVEIYNGLLGHLENIEVLLELGKEADDTELFEEAKTEHKAFVKGFKAFKTQSLLSGEFDNHPVVLSLNAGAGGTDAQDWVGILLRMYTRYANDKGYKVTVVDHQDGEEAGVKSATLEITGEFVYGHLKGERGVHRLVRLSPFDSSGKRHTSFASCSVTPMIEDDIQIDIKEEDLRIDTYRSSGAGGQHVNTTDSAIRIVHLPTGIVAQCQNQRSQLKNKETAMKILKAKLFEKERQDKAKELKELKGTEDDIAWGSQIRSYVFHPYSMVKDHRTEAETGNVKAVIDGDLDLFVAAYLEGLAS